MPDPSPRGAAVAVVVVPGRGVGLAGSGFRAPVAVVTADPAATVAALEARYRPRWVMWSQATAGALVAAGVRVATSWDVAAVHRLLTGRWRADPARAWAWLHDLDADLPVVAEPDLFTPSDDLADEPIRSDGHLHPAWVAGEWADTPERWARWAGLAVAAHERQVERLAAGPDPERSTRTARSESTAELLCAELAAEGLPVDRGVAEDLLAAIVGPRPTGPTDEAAQVAARQAEVLRHAPPGTDADLRSPGQVKALLRRVGVEVPDTRAWRLEAVRQQHPVVEALLVWRKADRVATTYGYRWLDEHVGADGRLRGDWTGSDGAAGRMTASAGLHNLPADLRPAVRAEPGHVLVRADLGQIEPRVLAAVSGDERLAAATVEDDLYAPVAAQLGVDRPTAKVAVLGAMYGQTTGHGAQALRRLHLAYPVAMAYLDAADHAARGGRDLRTYGGRTVRMGSGDGAVADDPDARSRAAARGRYGRNAMIQGAAAELFKVWALTVRARAAELDARIVLCLHDELLVHVPADHGEAAAELVDRALQEAAHRWAPGTSVRFVADTRVLSRWSDAKG